MNSISKKIIAGLFMLMPITASAYTFTEAQITPKNPIVGLGTALFSEGSEFIWVSLGDDADTYDRFDTAVTSSNINEDFNAVRLKLYGISTEQYKNNSNEKVSELWQKANSFVYRYSQNNDVSFVCTETTLTSTPECSIDILLDDTGSDVININQVILENGLSKLEDDRHDNNILREKLTIYEDKAKRQNIGVWREMFNLFEM